MYFEELLKIISPTLKRITHKLNGRFCFFNDEDLFQEAMLHLWVCFQEGKLHDKTTSYILQGCYFHLKNHIRKVQDKTNLVSINAIVDGESMDLEETLCLRNSESCFDDLENKILIEQIQNNGLTEREKEVFCLCLEGLTTREIGKHLGISHVSIVKARKNLRKKLKFLKESLDKNNNIC